MRISDWSSDVCSSDLHVGGWIEGDFWLRENSDFARRCVEPIYGGGRREVRKGEEGFRITTLATEAGCRPDTGNRYVPRRAARSEEHTSELQSLMRISYAVFCLKKKNTTRRHKIQ